MFRLSIKNIGHHHDGFKVNSPVSFNRFNKFIIKPFDTLNI